MIKNKTCIVNLREGRRSYCLSIFGHLDETLPNPTAVLGAVKWSGKNLLILDLSRADSADPRGLEWIEQFSAKASAEGVRVRLVAPEGSRIRRTLQLLRFDRFLVLATSYRSAVRFGRALGSTDHRLFV